MSSSIVSNALQKEVRQLTIAGMVALLLLALTLAASGGATLALRWLAPSLLCWAFVTWQCARLLPQNHPPQHSTLFQSLGWGTRTTLLRGLLIAACAGFLTLPAAGLGASWLVLMPAMFYSAAVVGDALDGFLARRQQHNTRLGAELDTRLDALGLLIAPLLAVLLGKLHASYLLVSVAFYLFRLGIEWRHYRNLPVYELQPCPLRRHLAGLQMVLVAVVLWPQLPAEITRTAGSILMLPSLLVFARDWLHVSGRRRMQQGTIL